MDLPIEKYLQQQLAIREQLGNKRALVIRGEGIDFFSNDYLGIARSGEADQAPVFTDRGSTGSRLLSGNSNEAMALEDFLADFHQGASALLFNSGYDANIGLLSAIANRHTYYLYDEYCHASMIDGMRLSNAKQHYKFAHNNLDSLASLLKKFSDADTPVIVLIESIYSMEGDVAPVEDIVRLCSQYNASLVVDEAHATGVIGDRGQGLVAALGLKDQVLARIFTFGKAIGAHGAVVVGSENLKQFLINFARSFIYSTALPPADILSIRKAYEILVSQPERRRLLSDNIQSFCNLKQQSTFDWLESSSPIQSLLIGNNQLVKEVSQNCLQEGLHVGAILSPTVPKDSERLRICLHSFNTENDFNRLFKILNKCLNK